MPDAAARHGPGDPGGGPGGPGEGPDAGRSALPGGDPIAELIVRLREIELDPDAEQLCDALWLARWTRPADAPADRVPGPGGRNVPPVGLPPARPAVPPPDGARPPEAAPEQPPYDALDRRVALYPVPRDGTGRVRGTGRAAALPVGVPAAPVLPAPLELQRALRPLQGYKSAAPPRRTRLDEVATAETSAQAGGLILPVHRFVTRGDARLQLVMDASSSMRVWDRLFAELEQVFGQLGAFSDIQISHLHQGPDGAAAVSRSPDAQTAPLHSADRLSDPTGRRIVVLVSDCAGPLWHSGHAHRLLHHLSRQGPVAMIQPLPQRMWARTRLPVTFGELTRGETPGGAALRVRTPAGTPAEARRGALPVPVLPPEPVALGCWARLLSGAGAGPVPGAVGWVRADQPPAAAARPDRPRTPFERVSRFSSAASPIAGRLAVYLAAAPLCLPVMQLVQRTMLPDSGPSELAEVLVSGLVVRAGADLGGDGAQWYEIEPDVRDALLSRLGRDEAMLVLKHCSEYIEQRFGKGGPNFPALALAQLGHGGPGRPHTPGAGYAGENGGNAEATPVPQPFAEVAARVLERFMPLPAQVPEFALLTDSRPAEDRPAHQAVTRARALLARFEAEGMVQDVIDAVQLLRGATEHERPAGTDPELWAEYAHCTLRLWEVQGGAALLHEAEQAAERAAAHPHALRERAVLARVLHAAATDRRRRGDRRGALDLLRRADREYAVACAAPGLDEKEALRLTLERVGALEAQWRLGGDSALLQGAVGMLEAFADAWPDRRSRPPELPLAHGRVLLRLSEVTADPVQARLYAEQGARSLHNALETTEQDDTAESVRARVRLLTDLLDAMLLSGGPLDLAQARADEALGLVREQGQRAALLVRAGRIAVARYAESGEPAELHRAAADFAQAAQRTPRDAPAHADVLAEWGEVLLRLAGLEGGPRSQEQLSRAIRVLRDCRMETPAGSRKVAHRLLLLGRALMLRYRVRGDRVDLREAEHLLGLAAADADDALLAARCRLELGQAQFEAYQNLGRATRLDLAVDAFRAAAESAREAEEEAETERRRQESVELAAQAHHWRGMSFEAAARPRAAREAYRAAHTEWARLPDDSLGTGEPTARQTAQRLAELE
ncbi:SAV_2336 N-terminal domain-related protein [Streptomyces sp. DH24]|uniref:SAV_2336 N-terminal domain-related protein n=1 Tax=Streptomyces sp. DH24 TaxID=3040123 RepID=UPI002441CE6D|nr:SAV_2336 N-terminal domain-related protein [Streptomyces sp. DH24]MDG9716561.1 SAV_2336 N-terminal domain-related protein [Streptomyces sp. DH24]